MASSLPDVGRVVVIGNGIAGTMAAETLRKLDPNVPVTVLAAEPHPLYNRVALPRLLRGEIEEQKVFMRAPDHHRRMGYDLRLGTRAARVDPQERVVVSEDGQVFPYDRLVVATGGRPNPLSVPGTESRPVGILYFQTLDDTRQLVERARTARRAVTVGGSYIAYELTEGLRRRGLEVTWLIRGPRFLRRILDEAGGQLVDELARRHGVEVLYGEEVARVQVRGGAVSGVVTTSGRTLEADLVACGLGLTLYTEFLQGTGIEVHRGIVTNEFLETSVPGIYAAGDVAEFFDGFVGRHHTMGTWDNATTHGQLAAANLLGQRRPLSEVPSYTSTLFDSTLYVLGMTPEDHPGLESISCREPGGDNYRRFFFLEDRLVGAVMIGERKGRRVLKQMIRGRQRVPPAERSQLFDLE